MKLAFLNMNSFYSSYKFWTSVKYLRQSHFINEWKKGTGIGSPTSSISQKSFQGDTLSPNNNETRKLTQKTHVPYSHNDSSNKEPRDPNNASPFIKRNRPHTAQGNNRRPIVQSPPPKYTSGVGGAEAEFTIGDLGESFQNWEETTRSAIMNRIEAHLIKHLLPYSCCF